MTYIAISYGSSRMRRDHRVLSSARRPLLRRVKVSLGSQRSSGRAASRTPLSETAIVGGARARHCGLRARRERAVAPTHRVRVGSARHIARSSSPARIRSRRRSASVGRRLLRARSTRLTRRLVRAQSQLKIVCPHATTRRAARGASRIDPSSSALQHLSAASRAIAGSAHGPFGSGTSTRRSTTRQ